MRPQVDIQIVGGRVVYVESFMSPYGRYYVLCDKHPDVFHNEIYFSMLDLRKKEVSDLIVKTAYDVLRQCPWCKSEQAEKDTQQKTRFPEGAEL